MRKIMLMILGVLLLIGCSDDDGNGSPLLGNWELMIIKNDGLYTSPEDESLVIEFEESEYTGRTDANEFGGDYSIRGNTIFLTDSYTSEVGDTAWGNMFYEALRTTYDEEEESAEFSYNLTSDMLVLSSEEGVELTFERVDSD